MDRGVGEQSEDDTAHVAGYDPKMIIKKNSTHTLWSTMQDHAGPANCWPTNIRYLMWQRHVKHWQRFLLATFVFVNMDPTLFMEWVDHRRMCRDGAARNHFLAFLKLLKEGRYKDSLYTFDTTLGSWVYLSGRPRVLYGPGRRN